MKAESKDVVKLAEHLFEIYPSMPRYANDPEESEIVRTYDFIVRRFQSFFSKQPTYFVKAGMSPLLFGDCHQYSGFPYLSFSSTQDIIVAVAKTSSGQIRINNYQTALYGEKVLSSKVGNWKFEEKEGEEKFMHGFIKILGMIASELSIEDFGGIDLMIYSGLIEDQFMAWKEAVYACYYTAITTIMNPKRLVESNKVQKMLDSLSKTQENLFVQSQLLNYKAGYCTFHQSKTVSSIPLPQELSIVLAHSLTPLPKKLIQGKRFNLRRCQILIALEYLKNSAGTTKDFKSLRQIHEFIGCTTEELMNQVEQNVPGNGVPTQQIEEFTEKSLIDILKEVPYANSVIDQNKQFSPKERALFFLKEEILMSKLTSDNTVEYLKESYKNQVQLLGIGSEQIQALISVAQPWTLAHKIVGNGWGGNVLFLCHKSKSTKLIEELMNNFYLSEENKILLSDDLEQYVHLVEKPGTGLAILDPQSEIWY